MKLLDYVFTSVYVITLWILRYTESRQTDVRWLFQPELTVKIIESENVTLRWIYKKPPFTRNLGKVTFAHHIPGNSYEDVLIEGATHPVTGELNILYAMFPDKVSMTCRGQEIIVEILHMGLSEYGRYLLDLKFDSDAAMHDVIDLKVFKNPSWIQTPQTEIHARTNSHATLKWKRDTTKGQPEIHGIILMYSTFTDHKTIEVIDSHRTSDSDIWETSYSPEGLALSDRMLHEYSPQRDVFQVSLWDLELSDSGQYELRLMFEDDVTALGHTVDLHVIEGSTWKVNPGKDVYGVLSNDVNLTYKPDINDTMTHSQKYKLYKYHHRKEEEVMTISVTQDGMTERRPRSTNVSRNIVVHHSQGEDEYGLLLTFRDVQPEHNGSYLLKMYLEETLAVKHSFNFRVVRAHELWPKVLTQKDTLDIVEVPKHVTEAGLHSFLLPHDLPRPHVTMYSGDDDDRVVHAEISRPESIDLWLTSSWLDQGITVIMDYEFYTVSFILVSSKPMALSQAAFISSLNQHTAEAIIVYITCFCLLAGNIFILIITCFIWRHRGRYDCQHCTQTGGIHTTHHTDENIYEIPLQRFNKRGIDSGDGLSETPNPRLRRPGLQSSSPYYDRESLLPEEIEPMLTKSREFPDGVSPILRNADRGNTNGSSKRVRWEGLPKLTYEQVEQHSPKLPRY